MPICLPQQCLALGYGLPPPGDPLFRESPGWWVRLQSVGHRHRDGPAWREDGPAWREDGPAWREDGPAWREDGPAWREVGPAWREDGHVTWQ